MFTLEPTDIAEWSSARCIPRFDRSMPDTWPGGEITTKADWPIVAFV